ncbi:MAG: undecaprenyldiphospho-muramoylpentapeptide beta-N-acetylglucosaminyltransferase [Desulfobacterales bacterium]
MTRIQPHSAKSKGMPLRVIMAGGGTGGHLFPAIALAQELRRREPDAAILFVSTGRPFEHATLARYGFTLMTIPVEGIKGKSLKVRLRAGAKAVQGVAAARKIVRRFRPDLMVSVGSYAAGPVGLAGWLAGIPLVLQEQNSVPGITHRMLSPLARRVYITFAASRAYFPAAKVRLLGNPLRRELVEANSAAPADEADSRPAGFTVLILGGSQGAHAINEALVAALSPECRPIQWIHQTGADDEPWVQRAYAALKLNADVRAFFTDVRAVYRKADLVICRAGASTITEITALGKPAILIPFPFAADDHQTRNARELSNQGAAETILESELSGPRIAGRIHYYRAHPDQLRRMGQRAADLGRPQAAREIVDDWRDVLDRPPLAA